MAQLYVMIPGRDQPQLLEVDELARRIKAGEIPDSAQVARLGETNWSPAKDLPELKEKLGSSGSAALPQTSTSFPSIPGAPSPISGASPSQAGAPSPFSSQAGASSPFGSQAGAPSPLGSQAGAPSPLAGKPGGLPKGALIGGGAGLVLLVVLVISVLLYRGSYSRGLVLEHLPEDCAELYYIDVAGVVTSDPVKSNLDKFIKNSKDLAEEEVSAKSKKDKERFEKALSALEKNGMQPTTLREMAVCVPTVDRDDKDSYSSAKDKVLIVVGGTFRKGDVLQGIKEAVEAAIKDEDACKIEDDDGLRMLKCSTELKSSKKEPIYAALVDSRVLAISPDKKTVKSVRASKDRAKTYSANKGEHVVIYRAKESPAWDGAFGESKLKVGGTDTIVTVETHYDPEKGKSKLDQFKDGEELVKKKEKGFKTAADRCFEKTPYDVLSESVERTKVEAFDDGIRYEYKVSNKDLGKVFKVLADADKEDMTKLFKVWSCIGSSVEPYVPSY